MGGRPLGVVDMLVSPDRAHAETVLDGIAWASEKLGVPVVGGHLTLGHAPSLAASCTGVAQAPAARLRRAARRRPDRGVRDRRPVHERDAPVLQRAARPRSRAAAHRRRGARGGGRAGPLPRGAGRLDAGDRRLAAADDRGRAARARRSTSTRCRGRTMRRSSAGCSRSRASGSCSPRRPSTSTTAVAAFSGRGLAAAACGRFDDTRVLRLAPGGREAAVWDLAGTPLTGLAVGAGSPSAGA